jgi:hypothetical protein
MRTPLTYVLMRSVITLVVLALLALFGAGLAGAGPWSPLAAGTENLVNLFQTLLSSGVWR